MQQYTSFLLFLVVTALLFVLLILIVFKIFLVLRLEVIDSQKVV
jgi:hypothetical protein